MKKPLLLLAAAGIIATSYLAITQLQSSKKDPGEQYEEQEQEGEENEEQSGAAKQLNTWFQAKGYPNAENLGEKYQKGWAQHQELKKKSAQVLSRGNSASNWASLGYSIDENGNRIGGRVVCMAIDPSNTNNLWVGSASGGSGNQPMQEPAGRPFQLTCQCWVFLLYWLIL